MKPDDARAEGSTNPAGLDYVKQAINLQSRGRLSMYQTVERIRQNAC